MNDLKVIWCLIFYLVSANGDRHAEKRKEVFKRVGFEKQCRENQGDPELV